MANTLDKIKTLTPVTITEFDGTFKVVLDDPTQTFTLSLVDTVTPANDFSEIFNPDAGKVIELTISVRGKESDA